MLYPDVIAQFRAGNAFQRSRKQVNRHQLFPVAGSVGFHKCPSSNAEVRPAVLALIRHRLVPGFLRV